MVLTPTLFDLILLGTPSRGIGIWKLLRRREEWLFGVKGRDWGEWGLVIWLLFNVLFVDKIDLLVCVFLF
jgi:hypothetical protein